MLDDQGLPGEVRGPAAMSYAELLDAADVVRRRLAREPGVADLDDIRESRQRRLTFVVDHEKGSEHLHFTVEATTPEEACGVAPPEASVLEVAVS